MLLVINTVTKNAMMMSKNLYARIKDPFL